MSAFGSPSRLVIASRKSDLARVQAYNVAEALRLRFPDLQIEHHFRESLGDINQTDPLWKMPEKGVFTVDLTDGLRSGQWDIVVHSWKDLPVETHPETEVVATLPRADQRDILVMLESRYQEFVAKLPGERHLKVLSSSPRRAHNLTPFLRDHWPTHPKGGVGLDSIEFLTVRGNIPTRVQKLMRGDGDVLILAKAALDRLLEAEREEFAATRVLLQEFLRQARWMVLPLSENPTAAAQGALAIEIKRTREDLRELLKQIQDPETFQNVVQERELLQQAGGGCHQKLGISVQAQAFGPILSIRGERPGGEAWVERRRLAQSAPGVGKGCVLPALWRREFLNPPSPGGDVAFYVSHPQALPENWKDLRWVWTAGLSTWRALAARGIWVNGTDDGLGEQRPNVDHLLSAAPREWVKLSHASADEMHLSQMRLLATYRLVRQESPRLDLDGYTHFYWRSFSQFQEAARLYPQILRAHHSCGVGNTAGRIGEFLRKQEDARDVEVFLNEDDWRAHHGFS